MKKTSVGGTESVRKKNGMKLGRRSGRELTGSWAGNLHAQCVPPDLLCIKNIFLNLAFLNLNQKATIS